MLIVVDPGVSTGVAMFDDHGRAKSFTTRAPFDELRNLIQAHADANVVAEDAPETHRHHSQPHATVAGILTSEGRGVFWIRPTSWKRHPQARLSGRDFDEAATEHERDAIRLGRWYLFVTA